MYTLCRSCGDLLHVVWSAESLTTTLAPIILPKLQWWRWSGVDNAGGKKGTGVDSQALPHQGGLEQVLEQKKTRMLRLLYRDPDNPDRVVGESTIQFMCLRGTSVFSFPMGLGDL